MYLNEKLKLISIYIHVYMMNNILSQKYKN
jgi:hypothetical protein